MLENNWNILPSFTAVNCGAWVRKEGYRDGQVGVLTPTHASPTPTVPMGAIGGDKPAWMAAIEENHLGSLLTHNPPGPPWVMNVGCWDGGARQGGGICKCVSGWPRALPPLSHPSLLLITLSVNLCSCPDTTLTPTPFSFRLCAVCCRTVLIVRVWASSAVLCVYNV